MDPLPPPTALRLYPKEGTTVRRCELTWGKFLGGCPLEQILGYIYKIRVLRARERGFALTKYDGIFGCFSLDPVIVDQFILMGEVREFGRTGGLRHVEPPDPKPKSKTRPKPRRKRR